VVLAEPSAHPGLLWHAPPAAQICWMVDDADAHERAAAGERVVALVRPDAPAPSSRASGVPLQIFRVADGPGPSGLLSGRRILVTRPRASAATMLEGLTARGADAVALPCLRIEPPTDLEGLDAVVGRVRDFAGVILSSRHGVDAFMHSLARVGLDARALFERQVVAVGRATARACARAGIVPDIVPTQSRSEGIVTALEQQGLLSRRWLHVRAATGRDTLSVAIEAAGGEYVLAAGYRTTRPAPPPGVIPWLRGGVDVICVRSGRTGEHLRAILADADLTSTLERARVVSGGPVTTEALQAQGFEVAATAASPDDTSMLQAVCTAGATATS